MSYYEQQRPEMLPYLPSSVERLLDIGCADGGFGAAVKSEMPNCETWGVEFVPAAAENAAKVIDRVICGSIYDVEQLPKAYFDVITMNDVFEHLPESEPVLKRVKDLLAPGGRLILSLPNVRYYLNVRDLVFRKDWKYQDFGILDRTHLRFFTQKSACDLLRENGFRIERLEGINKAPLSTPYKMLFTLGGKLVDDMRYPQFAVVASVNQPENRKSFAN